MKTTKYSKNYKNSTIEKIDDYIWQSQTAADNLEGQRGQEVMQGFYRGEECAYHVAHMALVWIQEDMERDMEKEFSKIFNFSSENCGKARHAFMALAKVYERIYGRTSYVDLFNRLLEKYGRR